MGGSLKILLFQFPHQPRTPSTRPGCSEPLWSPFAQGQPVLPAGQCQGTWSTAVYFVILDPGAVLACMNHHTPKCCSSPVLVCVRNCLQDVFLCRPLGLGGWGRCALLKWTISFHLSLIVNHTGKQTNFIYCPSSAPRGCKPGAIVSCCLACAGSSTEQILRFLPGWKRVQEWMWCCVVLQFF